MAESKINKPAAPKISLVEFVKSMPEFKAGKVEFAGAFDHWMENIKKITHATEEEFNRKLQEFKGGK